MADMLHEADAVGELTPGERAIWDSYQRFLHCITRTVPVSTAVAVAAQLAAAVNNQSGAG